MHYVEPAPYTLLKCDGLWSPGSGLKPDTNFQEEVKADDELLVQGCIQVDASEWLASFQQWWALPMQVVRIGALGFWSMSPFD